MRKQVGFSLIELLIVVAIILIIAAVAVPNLMRARISANESAAAANTRTIVTAEIQYHITFSAFSPDLASLGPPASGCTTGTPPSTNACLIDYTLASAGTSVKSGYIFGATATNTGSQSFVAGGTPSVPGRSGVKSFCGSEDGQVRFNPDGGPLPADCTTWTAIVGN